MDFLVRGTRTPHHIDLSSKGNGGKSFKQTGQTEVKSQFIKWRKDKDRPEKLEKREESKRAEPKEK